MISLVLVSRLNGESTRWVPPVAAVLLAATLGYAVFDTDYPVTRRQLEGDVWATMDILVARASGGAAHPQYGQRQGG
jgi:hypothetical protein